jgi:hypothetical protein
MEPKTFCDTTPDSVVKQFPDQIMAGFDEDSHYIILKRMGEGVHYAIRLFSTADKDSIPMYGAKVRLAYNDYYEDKSMEETLAVLSKEEAKFRVESLMEIQKTQIPWTEINLVRLKLLVGEEVLEAGQTEPDFSNMAKRFIANFEKLTEETVDDKMLVMVAIKDVLEYQARELDHQEAGS